MRKSERKVVARDLAVATSSVVTATAAASAVDGPEAWWLGAVTAVVSVALFAVADRSTAGQWALGAALTSAVGLLGVAIWWVTAGPLVAVVPPLVLGLGVGTAANRLLFGVVYPLPEPRRSREGVA